MKRRTSIKYMSIGTASALLWNPNSSYALSGRKSGRPAPADRKFISPAVDTKIAEVKNGIADEEIAWMFENCFPNTLDTTIRFSEDNKILDTFVITGDIDAMWLRDSSAQVMPYLPLVTSDPHLQKLIIGVINRQCKCILIDPYANAFNDGPKGSYWEKDLTQMKKELHEKKWEIDSLCYPIRLSYKYWKTSGDTSIFSDDWKKAMMTVIKTFREQQRLDGSGPYKFQRITAVQSDTVPLSGYGNPTKKIGLIHSIFRPSDDACLYPFLIPSNYFAATVLKYLSEIYLSVYNDLYLSKECAQFSDELFSLLQEYAIVQHKEFGRIYAYEIDGYGNAIMMDDANAPNLLSLAYFDAVQADDPVYRNTRRFILSEHNPYFFNGKAAKGVGSPHTGMDMIWPMSLIMQGLTTKDPDEMRSMLMALKRTHAGTGFMHESFHMDVPEQFTRKWFAWANTLFGEFVIKVWNEQPTVLKEIL